MAAGIGTLRGVVSRFISIVTSGDITSTFFSFFIDVTTMVSDSSFFGMIFSETAVDRLSSSDDSTFGGSGCRLIEVLLEEIVSG